MSERLREWGNRPTYWEAPSGKRGSYLPISVLGALKLVLWVSGDPHSLTEEGPPHHGDRGLAAHRRPGAPPAQEKLVEAATVDA
jgi:hypothetical protein